MSKEEANKATKPSAAFLKFQTSQNADRVIREIRESRGEVEAIELDLDRIEQILRLFVAAAHELGPFGVTVNNVSPGPVQTGGYNESFVALEENKIPLRRIGKPEDIANAIVFFASNQASWITGQRIYVGGGHNM